MDYKNATIVLTVQTEGRLAIRGSYNSVVKTDDKGKTVSQIERNIITGNMEKSDVIRLQTVQLPKYHKCEQHTTLGGAFCAFAVSDEARPKKTIGAPYWNKLSPKNRLIIGVKQYVQDMFGDAEFTFQIMGE